MWFRNRLLEDELNDDLKFMTSTHLHSADLRHDGGQVLRTHLVQQALDLQKASLILLSIQFLLSYLSKISFPIKVFRMWPACRFMASTPVTTVPTRYAVADGVLSTEDE